MDLGLIHEVQCLVDGATAHRAANLVATYYTAVKQLQMYGGEPWLSFATKAEHMLRSYLCQLRLGQIPPAPA